MESIINVNGRCAIGIMAKAPVAGHAKTRLMPFLTAEEAAMLSAAFLRDITDNITAAGAQLPIDCWIAYAPSGSDHLFRPHAAPGTSFLLADGRTEMPRGIQGLGRSLMHATASLLAEGYAAVSLVNGDSPTLPTARLSLAASLLLEKPERVVLGPTEDGGYYLIGMSTLHAALFQDISWSTDAVAAQTRARAAASGIPVVELDPWYDVDDIVLLDRLIAELDVTPAGHCTRFAAPATLACIARLGLRERRRAAQ